MTLGEHKVSVTARGEGKYDFVSRFFSPGVSVPEDPVTGFRAHHAHPILERKAGENHDVCPSGFSARRRCAL